MLDPMETASRWKKLKELVSKVQDPILRNAMMAEFKQRTIRDWGYCPDNQNFGEPKKEEIILTPDEQDFLDRIQIGIEYGIYVKDEKLERETLARMKQFIDEGHTFSDLPEEFQDEHFRQIYNKAFDSWLSDIDELIKYAGKTPKTA